MNILMLHGISGHAGAHWQQWLHDELKKDGYSVIMPSLPDSDHPDRQEWLSEVKQVVKIIEPADLIIVGHSLGVPTALDFVESLESPVAGLVSVAGFAVPYGLELNDYFMKEKTIDFEAVRSNVNKASVMYGDDDPYVTQEALQQLANALHVEPMVFKAGGHLNSETGYTKFPELLSVIRETFT